MSILKSSLPKTRNRVDGLQNSNSEILDKVFTLFKTHKVLTARAIGEILGVSREHAQREYVKPLILSGKIKKVEASKGHYQLIESKVTKIDLDANSLSDSEFLKTEFMKGWLKRTTSKHRMGFITRFARICLGEVNPNFKIHPDSITEENYHEVIANMINAILEVSDAKEISRHDREVLRFIIIFGLNRQLSQAESKTLGIVGDKAKPQTSTLEIKPEQVTEFKKLMKKESEVEFCKAGIKLWTGVRPSIIYTLETSDLIFYDRTVKYIENKDGSRNFSRDVIKYLENENPEKIKSYVHRACKIPKVYEYKQDEDYQKYVFDEEFVLALEKYCNYRIKFSKKRYLFWENNNTEFDFLTYDTIVRAQVTKDNTLLKKVLVKIGFKSSDFGQMFRANYGMRHFSIQSWLQYTNYNYDIVAKMFHKSVETTKTWYGEMVSEFFEGEISEVAL